MQFKRFWGMYCLGLILFIILVLIFMNLKVDAYDPQSELYPRTHELDSIDISYADAQLLMQIAAAEAEGEGPDGQRLIMSCVLNRLASPEFEGQTVAEIIYAPHQFYTAGMSAKKVNADTHLALADLEAGNLVPEVVAFEKTGSDFLEQYFTPVFTYRHHTFYVLSE